MNYERLLNKGMKVFSQLFVGMRKQSDGEPFLGFATPFETNSAFEKRKSTILDWCGRWEYKLSEDGSTYLRDDRGQLVTIRAEPLTTILGNTPREGFKITDDVKRVYWGGGNVVWRVYDPAGFELEIQSQNLMALIQCAGVSEGGLIPGKCIWGRDGKNNILLHETSEEYASAILAAENLKKPKNVAAADLQIGGTYLLQDASEGIYLGKVWAVCETTEYDSDTAAVLSGNSAFTAAQHRKRLGAPELYEAVATGSIEVGCPIRLYKKAPLVRLIWAGKLSSEERDKIISTSLYSYASSSRRDPIVYVHAKKFDNYQYTTVNISQQTYANLVAKMDASWNNYARYNKRPRSVGELAVFSYTYASAGSTSSVLLAQDGQLFGNYTELTDKDDNQISCMSAVKLGGTMVSGVALSHRPHNRYAGWASSDSTLPVPVCTLPKFIDLEQHLEWLGEQYAAGNLQQITVTPKE